MSFKRLHRNVQKYDKQSVPEVLSWKPIIITDSKGKYLKKALHKSDLTEKNITWYGRGGFNASNVVQFLSQSKIKSLLKIHNKIHFYIWVGTCDFTQKGKQFISLRRPVNRVQKNFLDNLLSIKRRCASSNIRITFLHVPFYSIRIWNQEKGHQCPENFKTDDQELTSIIKDTNRRIDELNNDIGSQSRDLTMTWGALGRVKMGSKDTLTISNSCVMEFTLV